MVAVGVLAKFEFKVDDDSAAESFFRGGKPIVDRQPATTVWFAYRLGPGVYGAFAAFASDEDRQALLSSGGPRCTSAGAGLHRGLGFGLEAFVGVWPPRAPWG